MKAYFCLPSQFQMPGRSGRTGFPAVRHVVASSHRPERDSAILHPATGSQAWQKRVKIVVLIMLVQVIILHNTKSA